MEFAQQLEKMNACEEAIYWAWGKSLEVAWEACPNPAWMAWLVGRVCTLDEILCTLIPVERMAAEAIIKYHFSGITEEMERNFLIRHSRYKATSWAIGWIKDIHGQEDKELAFAVAFACSIVVEFTKGVLQGEGYFGSSADITSVIKQSAPSLEIIGQRIEEVCDDIL